MAAEITTAASSQQTWGFSRVMPMPWTSSEARDGDVWMCASPMWHREAGHCPRSSLLTQPSAQPRVLTCSISKRTLLELNNSGSAALAGPTGRSAPPENANEANAAEQQQQPRSGPESRKWNPSCSLEPSGAIRDAELAR